ncbi:MAG: LON peptidase substrate-binding domain-containing protein [Chloroflexi bacterium]|nr:LON peptidase substrate-binding domain-containing protein [Chloroflexota bacterium]
MSQPDQIPEDDLTELSLFPLNVVLFPGMPLPLHIFEERYKAMIGDCLEREVPFGIVLIKEGREVGESAEPFRVGTTARIQDVERLPEGRLNIMTKGEQRFELVEIIQQTPHLVGMVKYLQEEAGVGAGSVIAEVNEGYSTFLRGLASLAGGWKAQAEAPQDPIELSFAVAASLASTIELPTDTRQELLEAPTAQERLERLVPLVKRGNEELAEAVAKRNPFQGPRLN